MKRSVRISMIAVAAAALLLLAVVLLAPWIIGQERIRETIAGVLHDNAGLELSLEAPPSMSLLPRPSLVLEGVTLYTPGSEHPLLQAERLDVALAITTLLQGEIEAAVLHLTAPVLHLEKDAQGRWNLPALPGEDTPASPDDAGLDFGPMAGALLEIENGTVVLEDKQQGHTWRLENLALHAEARIQGRTMRLPGFSLAFAMAQSPLPLPAGARISLDIEAEFLADTGALELDRFELAIMDSRLTLHGTAHAPFSSPSFKAELSLEAPSADLQQVFSLPHRPPALQARARPSGDAQRLRLEELVITANEESLEGSAELELTPKPFLRLRLAAKALDANALLLLMPSGGEDEPQAPAPPGQLLAWSREYGADMALEVDTLRLPGVEMSGLALSLTAGEGRVRLVAPAFGLAEGTAQFDVEAILEQAGQARFSLFAGFEGVELAPLMAGFAPKETVENVQGMTKTSLKISGAGASWEQLLHSTTGSLSLELRDGSIPGAGPNQEGQESRPGAPLEFSLVEGQFTLSSANAPESAPSQ